MKKPIKKKYNNKDLNIAYNDGYEQAKREILKKINEIKIYKGLLSKAEVWALNNDELCDEIEDRIKKYLKKWLR